MSITSDIRGYADTAIEQGKQAFDQAQAQLTDVAGSVSSSANEIVADLRAQAEKTINLDAIRAAVEPYLAQARQYTTGVTDRAEGVYASVRSDRRVARVVTTAEQVAGVVTATVQERVLQPVLSLTNRGTKPAPKATPKPATKSATKPAAKSTATARKAATTRPAPRTAQPAARKTTARKTAARKTTAAKTTAKKATPKA